MLLGTMYCSWCLDYTGHSKMKIKDIKNKKYLYKKWSTVRRKLFEMFLKTTDWKAIWNFCATIICGLRFDRTSRINCEKHDENTIISDTLV